MIVCCTYLFEVEYEISAISVFVSGYKEILEMPCRVYPHGLLIRLAIFINTNSEDEMNRDLTRKISRKREKVFPWQGVFCLLAR